MWTVSNFWKKSWLVVSQGQQSFILRALQEGEAQAKGTFAGEFCREKGACGYVRHFSLRPV